MSVLLPEFLLSLPPKKGKPRDKNRLPALLAALRAAAGNTAKAAVLLGISRPRVSQLVAEYKLANFRKRLIAERLMSEAAEPESPTVGAPVPQ